MRQAFSNLLDNAIQYTGRGWVGSRCKRAARMIRPVVRVRDTGMGIPAWRKQTKIWDRLYRGDKSRSQRGLGLGLSLVRAIVHAHQGRGRGGEAEPDPRVGVCSFNSGG